MIREAIGKVIEKKNLTEAEMVSAFDEIMSGGASPAQIGAFITALRMKGETIEEITGAARVMREKALHIKTKAKMIVDTCGTGGDESGTFNISTTAAFVTSGAGLTVAKHGNKSVSSKSGSADVLRSLGVNIEVEVSHVERCLDEIGIGFLFAPLLHGAMKHAIGPRREIGIRTIFNILGPLTNPAGAHSQVLGVYDYRLTEPLARVLQNLGSTHVFVVHGADGLDEITLTGKTFISELKYGEVENYEILPEDFGFERCKKEELLGGDSETNARITLDILKGKNGPHRDIVLLNAAAVIVAGGKSKDLREGLKAASESIDSGMAMKKLDGLRRLTNEYRES
ncbi:MAG: anthranilate phosphoribosyltransferase [Nitrospinae bacterium RIFCSPLOWO2_12_39_16]|nr:MAG: anthranilate phosphoribosyltransferase [Nitrospinae bacterium RIFCSPLOWO2_02_39_17]OGW07656.1 MAG: anthranilate phosphoribosyltransferase [Nitrospinae bacterium RIFCSPLOWO2_12_39_16]